MNLTNTQIYWTSGEDTILLAPFRDTQQRDLLYNDGACWMRVRQMNFHDRVTWLALFILRLCTDYNLDRDTVDEALRPLDEWQTLSALEAVHNRKWQNAFWDRIEGRA